MICNGSKYVMNNDKEKKDSNILLVWGILISVRSWNFRDGGSLKASFLAKIQHATKEKSLENSYK